MISKESIQRMRQLLDLLERDEQAVAVIPPGRKPSEQSYPLNRVDLGILAEKHTRVMVNGEVVAPPEGSIVEKYAEPLAAAKAQVSSGDAVIVKAYEADEGAKNVEAAKRLASAFTLLVQGEKVRIPGCDNWSLASISTLRGAGSHDRGTEQQVMPQYRWAAEEMLRFFTAYQGEVTLQLKGPRGAVDVLHCVSMCADALLRNERHIVFPGEAEMLLHFKEHLAGCLHSGFDDSIPYDGSDCAENYSLVSRRYRDVGKASAEEMVKLLDYALAGGRMSIQLEDGSFVPLRSVKLGDLATCQIHCDDPKAPIRILRVTEDIMMRVAELGTDWRAMRGSELVPASQVTNITARDKSVNFRELLPTPFSVGRINELIGCAIFCGPEQDPFLLTGWKELTERGYNSFCNPKDWQWWPVLGERVPQPAYEMAWGPMRLA